MKSIFGILLGSFLFFNFAIKIEGLSCFCGTSPCEFPRCCDSGYHTGDLCGCCQVCANGKGESCGGPWNSNGRCGVGLSCFRSCQCNSVEGSPCIFPFNYKGVTYTGCTTENSENGKPWCAIKVDAQGTVVPNKWQDCQNNCPGAGGGCDSNNLFNEAGVCVDNAKRSEIEKNQNNGLPFQFDDGEKNTTNTIQTCNKPEVKPTCSCTKQIPRGQDGNCLIPYGSTGGDFSDGWCFLEHVEDPENPTKNCYEDAQWSKANGRFWSNVACKLTSVQPNPTTIQ